MAYNMVESSMMEHISLSVAAVGRIPARHAKAFNARPTDTNSATAPRKKICFRKTLWVINPTCSYLAIFIVTRGLGLGENCILTQS